MFKKLCLSLVVFISSLALADSAVVHASAHIEESSTGLGSALVFSQLNANEPSSKNINDLVLALNADFMRPMPHYEICENESKTKLCYCPGSICWTFKEDCFCD